MIFENSVVVLEIYDFGTVRYGPNLQPTGPKISVARSQIISGHERPEARNRDIGKQKR